MFECPTADAGSGDPLSGLTGHQLASLVESNHRALLRHENQVLQLAAAWADLHDADPLDPYAVVGERSCLLGGPGTPEVAEYAAAEFAALQGTTLWAGRSMIADALDLRHRLPRLWDQVKAGQVRAWQARKVAQATHGLPWAAAADVDDAISGYLGMIPWTRFTKILDAAILDADPATAAERAHRARTERNVWTTNTDHGLKTLIAKTTAEDATWLMATINRIADILKADGDPNPINLRRATAIGILAQPAHALQLLIDHQHDTDQPEGNAAHPFADSEPAHPEPVEETTDAEADPPEPELPEPGAQPDRPVWTDADELVQEPPSADDPDERTEAAHHRLDLNPPSRPFNAAGARPRVVLHFHLTDTTIRDGHGTIRPEHGSPATLIQLHEFLSATGCQVTVQPVLDPADVAPIDGYEIPQRIRAAVRLRNPADTFPYGTCTSATMDVDHTIPYQLPDHGGPPGQTGLGNLGPLSRTTHRYKTHSRWQVRQPDPGAYVWRSPHGRIFVVTNHGTLNIGNSSYAHAIWHAATQADERAPAQTAA